MQITVKLGGPLRKRMPGLPGGETTLDLEPGTRVSQVLTQLDLGGDAVRVIMLNGRPLSGDDQLAQGDRLAMWPREIAFNMYMATNFFNPLARQAIEEDKKG